METTIRMSARGQEWNKFMRSEMNTTSIYEFAHNIYASLLLSLACSRECLSQFTEMDCVFSNCFRLCIVLVCISIHIYSYRHSFFCSFFFYFFFFSFCVHCYVYCICIVSFLKWTAHSKPREICWKERHKQSVQISFELLWLMLLQCLIVFQTNGRMWLWTVGNP